MSGTQNLEFIREFIYVDIPKLYSLYSQFFGGVTEQVIEQSINQKLTGSGSVGVFRTQNDSVQASDSVGRLESIFLHDHMYNLLEEKLHPLLQDLTRSEEVNLTKLVDDPFIKVSGRAEIEDYSQLSTFVDNFNRLSDVIAHAQLDSPQTVALVEALKAKLSITTDKQEKREITAQLQALSTAKGAAKALGLSQDETLLKNLKFFAELFKLGSYEVGITPKNNPQTHYRGIVDKSWLRTKPDLLSSQYGGQSEAEWIMVGVATHVQGTFVDLRAPQNEQEQEEQGDSDQGVSQDEDSPMMLDSFRGMFRQQRSFERMFLETKNEGESEVVVAPLAIYREFKLNVRPSDAP